MTDNYPSIDEITAMLDCAKRELISMRDEITNLKIKHQAELKAAITEIEIVRRCAQTIRDRTETLMDEQKTAP